ncbi:MAG: phage tail tape measure protein [Saccharofermentanales bacterium]|mgnify:FL=1|jgi:TP901 family phage tail tape measure protein
MADDFGLKIGIEGEKEFKNALRDINQAFKVLGSEMNLVASQFDKQDKSVEAITARNRVLNKEIDTQRQKISTLEQALANAAASFGETDKRTQNWQIQLNNAQAELNKMERELDSNNKALEEAEKGFDEAGREAGYFGKAVDSAGKELGDAGKETGDFGKEVDKAGKELDEAGDEADEFGNEIEDASKKTSIFGDVLKANLAADAIKAGLKALVSLIKEIGSALKSAIDAGIEFESAFAGVRKTVEATEEQYAALEEGIRSMAMEIPASAAEIAGIAEMAGQLGIQTDNIIGFTRVMADLGNATNLTGEEAATTFAQFANITKMDQGDFDKLGSSIVALGNNFATTEADIAQMGKNLAAAGTQVGMSQADIMGLATALSSMGIEAQAGGTAFSKVMVSMQVAVEKGGDALNDFARVAGMSADEFATLFREDATGAIIAFTAGLANAEEQGMSAIGMLDEMGIKETRLRDSLLRAANGQEVFTSAIELSNQAWQENTALTNEAAQRYETMESQLAILKNTATDFGIEIYQSVQQPMMEVVKLGQTYMKQLNDAFKEGGFEGLVEEAGTVLSEILSKIMEFAPKIVDGAVSMIGTLIEGIVAALPGITKAAIQIILALVDGLISMLPLILEGALQIVIALANGIGQALPELLPKIVEVIVAIVQTLIGNIPMLIDAALQLVIGLAQGLLNAIPVLIEAIPQIVGSLITALLDSIPLIIRAGIDLLTSLVTSLPDIITAIVDAIPEIIGGIVTALIDSIPQIVQAGIDLLIALVRDLPRIIVAIVAAIPQIISSIIDALTGNLPKLIEMGVTLIVQLAVGLVKAIPELIKAIPQIIAAILTGLGKAVGSVFDIGKNIVTGLWNGIKSMVTWIKDKISDFVGGIVSGVKGLLGIRSPSTIFAGIGDDMAQGIGVGFDKAMAKVAEDMRDALPTSFDVDSNVNVNGSGGLGGLRNNPLVVVQQMIVRSEDDIRRISQELYNLMQTGARAQGRFSPA